MTPPPALHAAPARHAEAALRVALVAEDAVTARRATRALEADGIVVSADGRIPDVVVLACDISRTPNTSTLRRLRREHGEVGIVVVATGSRHGNVHETVNMGADGFLLETELESTLAVVVRAVSLGHVSVPRLLRRCLVRPAFSHREREILALVVEGLRNREIADRLFLAESTVKSHVASSLAKLGVRSRKEAVALVLDPDEGLRALVLGEAPEGPRPVQALRPQA